jgi:hypothetical protein
VIDGDERLANRPRRRFRERHADQQGTDQTRPLRHRDRVKVVPAGAAIRERALDDAADVAHVLARRELRHHAAPFAMDVDLRRDDVGSDLPAVLSVGAALDQCGRGLVARGFNPQDQHCRFQIADFRLSSAGIRGTAAGTRHAR